MQILVHDKTHKNISAKTLDISRVLPASYMIQVYSCLSNTTNYFRVSLTLHLERIQLKEMQLLPEVQSISNLLLLNFCMNSFITLINREIVPIIESMMLTLYLYDVL